MLKSYFQTYFLSSFFSNSTSEWNLYKPEHHLPSKENTVPQYKCCLVSLKYCIKNPGDSVTPIDQKPGQKDLNI